jgi:hypothetical protein
LEMILVHIFDLFGGTSTGTYPEHRFHLVADVEDEAVRFA